MGLYAPREYMEPTINGEVCAVDDINRIHTTDYNEMAPEAFRQKIQMRFENAATKKEHTPIGNDYRWGYANFFRFPYKKLEYS